MIVESQGVGKKLEDGHIDPGIGAVGVHAKDVTPLGQGKVVVNRELATEAGEDERRRGCELDSHSDWRHNYSRLPIRFGSEDIGKSSLQLLKGSEFVLRVSN